MRVAKSIICPQCLALEQRQAKRQGREAEEGRARYTETVAGQACPVCVGRRLAADERKGRGSLLREVVT